MRNLLFSLLLLWPSLQGALAQDSEDLVDWSPEYRITLEDFRSPATRIHPDLPGSSMQSGIRMGFLLKMNAAAFLFTRNFNPKVSCTLQPSAAFLTAPDSTTAAALVNLARFEFDLTELYARKFRKALFENKKTFSDVSFFQPFFQKLQAELNAESSRVSSATRLGQDTARLEEEHARVREQLQALADYCKACKPPRR
ncbi:hypothetical protein OZ410_08020 [Robiginitalea sp. M366]|uniref:hypothetical protein n=1 Tax=Robiginitalea aestuariiviva TaxID=3036903 RepID=UPI00240D5AD7|nr:hypothetical protein [Robiginitalea aestuariiviva]MDG1572258.1 hypothetical protein [Robiginitalea aestuariiviva]